LKGGKVKYLQVLIISTVVLTLSGGMALGEWGENFDSYATGSGIIGQGGWEGWDGDPATDAYVSDNQYLSDPNSLRLDINSDVIHQFSDMTGPAFLFEMFVYNPSNATGNCYINVLDEYNHGGPYNWITQVEFGGGYIRNFDTGDQLPLITDQWVSLTIEYAHSDMRIIYHGDDLTWIGFSAPGTIAALNFYSDDGTEMYLDEIYLVPTSLPTKSTSMSQIKSLY
jgi:hypothetical protein